MSDPVTNAEVEDVLSSIRRLVSEDKRPLQAPKPPAPAEPERLVLTAAQRIEDEEEIPSDTLDLISKQLSEELAVQEEERAPAPEVESLITDDEPLDVYSDNPAPFLAVDDAEPEPENDVAGQFEDDYSDDPYNFDDDDDTEGEAEELILSTAAEEVEEPADVEDEFGEELETALEPGAAEPTPEPEVSVAPDVLITPPPVAAAPEETPVEAETTSEPPSKAVALSAKIAALETAINKISDTWEPDDTGDSEYAGTEAKAMEWEEDETAEEAVTPDITFIKPTAPAEVPDPVAAAEPEPEVSQTAAVAPEPAPVAPEPEATVSMPGDEQLLDEDALRDLVSEIVRSELQGALGERITRNVRKLVRREIHRALTAQDLE